MVLAINLVCIVACSSDRCECCSIGWGRKGGAFRRGITGKAGQCIAKDASMHVSASAPAGAKRRAKRPCLVSMPKPWPNPSSRAAFQACTSSLPPARRWPTRSPANRPPARASATCFTAPAASGLAFRRIGLICVYAAVRRFGSRKQDLPTSRRDHGGFFSACQAAQRALLM